MELLQETTNEVIKIVMTSTPKVGATVKTDLVALAIKETHEWYLWCKGEVSELEPIEAKEVIDWPLCCENSLNLFVIGRDMNGVLLTLGFRVSADEGRRVRHKFCTTQYLDGSRGGNGEGPLLRDAFVEREESEGDWDTAWKLCPVAVI